MQKTSYSRETVTTGAIFIVRQFQEKYLARNIELWMAFVDLEKAFHRVPREFVWKDNAISRSGMTWNSVSDKGHAIWMLQRK